MLYSRTSFTMIATLAALLTSGCQSVTDDTITSQFRVIDASPYVSGVDLYQEGTAVAYNLGFGNVTSYVSVSPGVYELSARASGSAELLLRAEATFGASGKYTVLVGGSSDAMRHMILKDQTIPAPSGEISLRFVHQAADAGPVDVYLTSSAPGSSGFAPLLKTLTFNGNSGYIKVPAGNYKVQVSRSSVDPEAFTLPLYSGPSTHFGSSSARTIILLDHKAFGIVSVQLLTAVDYDPDSTTK